MSIMREKCERCGHAYSFHGRAASTRCRAVGCKKGPKQAPCQGFKPRSDAPSDLRDDLKASRAAQRAAAALSG